MNPLKTVEAFVSATTRVISFFTVRPVTQMLIYRLVLLSLAKYFKCCAVISSFI